jgi:hypothetical protein
VPDAVSLLTSSFCLRSLADFLINACRAALRHGPIERAKGFVESLLAIRLMRHSVDRSSTIIQVMLEDERETHVSQRRLTGCDEQVIKLFARDITTSMHSTMLSDSWRLRVVSTVQVNGVDSVLHSEVIHTPGPSLGRSFDLNHDSQCGFPLGPVDAPCSWTHAPNPAAIYDRHRHSQLSWFGIFPFERTAKTRTSDSPASRLVGPRITKAIVSYDTFVFYCSLHFKSDRPVANVIFMDAFALGVDSRP